MHKAKLGDRVRIRYSCVPAKGSATGKPPGWRALEFTVGGSDVIPGLSVGVVGMEQGDQKRVTLQPPDAYGAVQPALLKIVPRQRFPKHLVLRVGKRLTAVETVSRRRRRVTVVRITDDSVTVDGNHPLAGKMVELEVCLISLASSSDANRRTPQFDRGGNS